MEKFIPDWQTWLDDTEEEVFFYLRKHWPLFKQRDELRLQMDDMMQFCVGSEKNELFEDFRYAVENILSIDVHRCWTQGMTTSIRGYLQQPVKPAAELMEADLLGTDAPLSIDAQRVQLYRFDDVHDAYNRLIGGVTMIYLPIITEYVDNCLLISHWQYLGSFVHGYQSGCDLLARLGYRGGSKYLSCLYHCLEQQFQQKVFSDF